MVSLTGVGLVAALILVLPILDSASPGSANGGTAHAALAATLPTTATAPMPPDAGEELYVARCMSCHQMTGEGIPGVFPPLANSVWVQGEPGRVIRVVLGGLSGELEVAVMLAD
jgi:mono/diheme cytochrome c family protein